jgi:hypothetical protein
MAESGRRWLILVHQLPPRPSNLRVRVWRRLQQVGAVVLRNSLYVLPATDEGREDFNWVREEIRTSGGQVSVLEASAVDGYTDRELVQQFRDLRTAEYEALAAEIHSAGARTTSSRRTASPRDRHRSLEHLKEQLAAIQARDYFDAPGRDAAEKALRAALQSADGQPGSGASVPILRAKDYRGRTWVTRPRPGIDRFASAWFVRQFVDPKARFGFADPKRALRRHDIPYDMPDVEFGHQGAHCTFETLVRRFSVDSPGVAQLAGVVHDLDFKESRHGMPECAAVARMVDGLRARFDDDSELLEHGMVMVDALYRSFAAGGASGSSKRRVSK